jgi:DNA-binding MarR family transcriptional regulator
MSEPKRIDLGVLLALAYTAFVEEMRAELAAAGFAELHRSFGYVARALAEGPLTLAELAARLQISSPGALKIVDEMEAAGQLERRPDPADGRARRLWLTPRGEVALAAARRFHARFEARLGKRVGARQAAACRRVLESIVDSRARAGAPPALRPV